MPNPKGERLEDGPLSSLARCPLIPLSSPSHQLFIALLSPSHPPPITFSSPAHRLLIVLMPRGVPSDCRRGRLCSAELRPCRPPRRWVAELKEAMGAQAKEHAERAEEFRQALEEQRAQNGRREAALHAQLKELASARRAETEALSRELHNERQQRKVARSPPP